MRNIQKGKQTRRQDTSFGWLQGKVAHFLYRNPIFCKVVWIYMPLTCHIKTITFQIYGLI